MVVGLEGIFFVFPEGFEVERGGVGIFCGVGAEAVQGGLRIVADFFQIGSLVVGELGTVEGEDGLQA